MCCFQVCADTNREMEWPLLHGEVSCLRTFNAIPRADRPKEKELFFIATHEPCSLCLSAITWSGFDNFYYLFGYDDTKDAFGIPHDLKILQVAYSPSFRDARSGPDMEFAATRRCSSARTAIMAEATSSSLAITS